MGIYQIENSFMDCSLSAYGLCYRCGCSIGRDVSPMTDNLIELLADLIHDEWKSWATAILGNEHISEARAKRWLVLIAASYKDLPEPQKELDRVWAKKVIEVFQSNGYLMRFD